MREKVRFGVVGTNFISDWMINGARQDERFELTAICSRKQETADAFAKKHCIPKTFTSFEEMCNCKDVDAVYIASPNFLHCRQAVTAMSHGKHVLCEKPFATSRKEAELMAGASERYGVTLMEAMKPTMTPNFLSVMKNIEKAGTVRRYFSSYCQYSSRYDKLKEGIVLNAFNPEYANGAAMDIGIYTIYPMIVLFGMPKEIRATGLVLYSGTDGQGTVNFKYDNMEATVIYSKISDSYLPTEIQGENGTILLDRINSPGEVLLRSGKTSPAMSGQTMSIENLTVPTEKDEYYYEMAEFIDLILSGKRESAINSHFNSVSTATVLEEIYSQLGIKFPAQK